MQPSFAISLASIVLREVSKSFILLASTAIQGGYLTTCGNKPFLFSLLASFFWCSSTVLGKAALKQIPFELMTCIRLIVTGTVAVLIITSWGNISEYIAKTLDIVKGHINFHRYLISRVFYSSCLQGLGLYTVYCQDKFIFELSEAGVFTDITVLSVAISSFFRKSLR